MFCIDSLDSVFVKEINISTLDIVTTISIIMCIMFCSLFSVPCSLFSFLFPVLYFLFPVLWLPFPVHRSLFLHFFIPNFFHFQFFLFSKAKGNKARQTDRQTSPSSVDVGLHRWTFVVLSKPHARHSHPFVRENEAGFIVILRLLFIFYMLVDFWYIFTHFPSFAFHICISVNYLYTMHLCCKHQS